MTWPHWAYVAMLAFCLAGTLPLVPAFGLSVLRQPRRLLLTIALAGTPFLLWDLYATASHPVQSGTKCPTSPSCGREADRSAPDRS